MKIPSFAKINWTLRVLGERSDGYHEVFTVLQNISLSDELTFDLRDDDEISLTCDNPQIPVDESNLVLKAAHALYEADRGVDIHLKDSGQAGWSGLLQRSDDAAGVEPVME